MVELWKSVFPDNPARNEPARVIAAKLAVDDMIFVAENRSEIIGACMAGYDGHRGWLYAVAVSPEHRRNSTGTVLVKHAIQTLKGLGCTKVNLQIRAFNTEVVRFYESLGFTVEDRINMGKIISPTAFHPD